MDPRFEIQTCASLLSDWQAKPQAFALTRQELARAHAIGSTVRRDQFLAGRLLAKKMLAEAQGGLPTDWCISADGHAKPMVVGHDLQLSISHSGPFVACCIADHAAGIDVERLDRVRPVADMATLVCSADEQSTLHPLQGDALTLRFLQLWTCKEARLKQSGLPFDMQALGSIHMVPVTEADAHVGTWHFSGQQQVTLSLAVQGLSRVCARWPADWVVGSTQWYRYI